MIPWNKLSCRSNVKWPYSPRSNRYWIVELEREIATLCLMYEYVNRLDNFPIISCCSFLSLTASCWIYCDSGKIRLCMPKRDLVDNYIGWNRYIKHYSITSPSSSVALVARFCLKIERSTVLSAISLAYFTDTVSTAIISKWILTLSCNKIACIIWTLSSIVAMSVFGTRKGWYHTRSTWNVVIHNLRQ